MPFAAFLVLVADLTIRANVTRSSLDMSVFAAGLAAFIGLMGVLLIQMYRDFRIPSVPDRAT